MQVLLTKNAQKQLNKISNPYCFQIRSAINALFKNPIPSDAVKLVGEEGFRIRVGDYRILYWVDFERKTVTITRIAHRREAYRRW